MEGIVRRADPADAEGIAKVQVRAWQKAYRGLLPDGLLDSLSIENSTSRWKDRLVEPWGEFLVSERDGRVIGFVACGPCRDEGADPEFVGEIYALYVAPEEWRQGVGKALMVSGMEALRKAGNRQVRLWVLYNNEDAQRFYEAMGFEADGVTRVKTRSDGTAITVSRYRRAL